jgi:aspartate/methionine/tyrosine aminotransferase
VLQLPVNQSSDELAMRLLKRRGVYLHPGHFYEFAGERFVVVSLITPAGDFADGVRASIHCATANQHR